MSKQTKLLLKILSGRSDSNITFAELTQLLMRLKFEVRIRGDHHIFTHNDVNEILNLQPQNAMAKAYQVKQVTRCSTFLVESMTHFPAKLFYQKQLKSGEEPCRLKTLSFMCIAV